MVRPRSVLVRPPGDSLVNALSDHPDSQSIDAELARVQHAHYCQLLSSVGLVVVLLPPVEELPDSCFTADTGIVLRSHALLAKPGARSRQPEIDLIAPELKSRCESIRAVRDPATMDGGDILICNELVIVGHSNRTNEDGIKQAMEFAEGLGFKTEIAEVLPGTLHLLTSASAIDNGAVIGLKALLDQQVFEDLHQLIVPDDEALGCNIISIGKDVIASSGYPARTKVLEDAGLNVHEVDLSEFEKADGGPSCLLLAI